MSQTPNRYGNSFAAACLCVVFMWIGAGLGVAQSYPFPKPKPPLPSSSAHQYPLPTPNPRRSLPAPKPEPRKAVIPIPKPKRPKGSRAVDADETDGAEEPARGWSTVEVAEARRACARLLKGVALTYTEAEPIGGPGRCGIAAPIKVTSIGDKNSVTVSPPAILNCQLAAAAVRWMDTKVQVLSLAAFGEPVAKIRNAASYVCRRRNNSNNGKLSEHALGNAIDVSSFTLASGTTVTVLKGWRGQKDETLVEEVVSKVIIRETPESRFLKQVHKGACEVFSTILGPEADKYHVDHFHLDLGRDGRYLVCR